ncbi:MAG: alpha/beta fold hydrolase [Desulfobulbaceae bacterium]|nr:alpha/beta fold hydrolase [Candidatus Kapabacteria bacterium]MBS3999914.1 alpha/beta fold hydrolase [Desulfobulbaceae bacterium]
MKKYSLLIALFVFFYSSVLLASPIETAEAFIVDYFDGKITETHNKLDSAARKQISEEQLIMIRGQIDSQLGALKSINEPAFQSYGGNDVFVFPVVFEKGELDITVVVSKTQEISTFFMAPRANTVPYQVPDYADTTKFSEVEITFQHDRFILPGTISIPNSPKEKVPAVFLVHGSGAHDRDESIGPNKIFRDIAWGLSTKGIAVLRYEKRTYTYGNEIGDYIDKLDLSFEVIDDAVSAAQYLHDNADKYNIDKNRIFVLGHSLGGGLLPRIDVRQPKLKGLIALAGMGRRIENVLVDQYGYLFSLDGEFTDDEKAILEELKDKLMTALSPELNETTSRDSLPLNLPAHYWLDFRTMDGAREAKSITKPILVLHGERDYQVTQEDFDIWKEALKSNKQAKFISYPGLNHLFLFGEQKSNPQEYYIRGNVNQKVIEDIVNWIQTVK